jgi:hypothetical protein
MADFTPAEVERMREDRGLSSDQIGFIQNQIKQYKGQITKEELLNVYRRLGYMSNLLADDLKARFGKKE